MSNSMGNHFPVVVTHRLPSLEPRRGFRRKPVRDLSQIPRADVNHQRVFRVGYDLVLDDGTSKLDPDMLIEATEVALVNITRDVAVPVVLTVPTGDAGDFVVEVTFSCTVTDAVEVVRAELTDLGGALKGYLRRYPRIIELGLELDPSQINLARGRIDAELTAYTIESPPVYLGVAIELASIEVSTPANLLAMPRETEQRHEIVRERSPMDNLELYIHVAPDADRRAYQLFREHGDALKVGLDAYFADKINADEFVERMLRQKHDEQAVEHSTSEDAANAESKNDSKVVQSTFEPAALDEKNDYRAVEETLKQLDDYLVSRYGGGDAEANWSHIESIMGPELD